MKWSELQAVVVDPMWDTQQGQQGIPGIQGNVGLSVVGQKGEAGADADSFNPRGTWQRSTQYEPLDIVTLDGSSFVARVPNIRKRPSPRSKVWQILAVRGQTGERGPAGVGVFGRGRPGKDGKDAIGGNSTLDATFGSDTLQGMAIYVTQTGIVELAQANDSATTGAVGFAAVDVVANQSGSYLVEGQISRVDWTSVAGSATLVPGDVYYLSVDEPGQIANVSTATAGEYVVTLGRAIGSTTLDIEIQLPILLSGNVTPGSQGNTPLSAIHDSATVGGQAVYVSSSGHVDLALASNSTTTGAIGIAFADTIAGEIGQFIAEGQAERSDWTTVTGEQTLVAGDTYFLSDSDPGMLTNVAPTDPVSYVAVIGRALSDSMLDIEIACPILLTGNVAAGDSLTTTLETFTVTPAQAASGEIQLSADVANEQVFVNGLHQVVDEDYTLNGSLIVFGAGCLSVGDIVAVKYELA